MIPYIIASGPIVWTRILEPSTDSPLFRTFCTVVSFNMKGIEGLVRRIENPRGISTLKPYTRTAHLLSPTALAFNAFQPYFPLHTPHYFPHIGGNAL